MHIKNADTINESVTREHAQKFNVTIKDLHFYLIKELFKRMELRLTVNKEQLELIQQKRKTRTSSSIQSFKPSERKTFLNFLNEILKDEPEALWQPIDINDSSQQYLTRFQDGIIFWYVPNSIYPVAIGIISTLTFIYNYIL